MIALSLVKLFLLQSLCFSCPRYFKISSVNGNENRAITLSNTHL